jgi:alginate O-acetyltransferase complex protein AlgI
VLFNSFEFVLFFLIVLMLYNVLNRSKRFLIMLFASYFFYAYWSIQHICLLIVVTIVTYFFGIWLDRRKSSYIFIFAVALSIIPLFIFKYIHFATKIISYYGLEIMSSGNSLDFILPIGISFYTLQALSYLSDIYMQKFSAERNFNLLTLYLAFFPQILSGPIERAEHLIPQLKDFYKTKANTYFIGAKHLLWGFFCKLIIADKIGIIVDNVIGNQQDQSGISLAIALVLYAFQIYYDFYGYTQIAIGLAKYFGVNLSINFNNPYLAVSLQDFWRRWHITLSTWFRDYIYIPLGGKNNSHLKYLSTIMLVFMLSGLWHGASINFVIWGLVHGVLFLGGRLTWRARNRARIILQVHKFPIIYAIIQRLTVFFMVCFAWLFFRVEAAGDQLNIMKKLFMIDQSVPFLKLNGIFLQTDSVIFLFILIIFFTLHSSGIIWTVLDNVPKTKMHIVKELAIVNSLMILIVLAGDIGSREFIYFQF